MATLNSHTARALADERVRELRDRSVGVQRGSGQSARRGLAGITRGRSPRVGDKPRAETSFALAATVRYLRRRVSPDRG